MNSPTEREFGLAPDSLFARILLQRLMYADNDADLLTTELHGGMNANPKQTAFSYCSFMVS